MMHGGKNKMGQYARFINQMVILHGNNFFAQSTQIVITNDQQPLIKE